MKRYFFLLLLLCTIAACGTRPAELRRTLEDVASFIEDRPDSAYAVLDAMDREALSTRALRARHAVLYSMALDKNYIDLTTDSIINVAYDYYRHHGTPDDKLKAGYYLARIYENRGEMAKAMAMLSRTEYNMYGISDYRTAGRLYTLKGKLYYNILDIERAYENSRKSSEAYQKAGFTRGYIVSLLDEADCYILLNRFEEADALLDSLSKYRSVFTPIHSKRYFNLIINRYSRQNRHEDGLRASREAIHSDIPFADKPWLDIAEEYQCCGLLDSAKICIDNYLAVTPAAEDDTKYHLIYSELMQASGDYSSSLDHYQKYMQRYDESINGALRMGIGFSEEQSKLQSKFATEQIKRKASFVVGALIVLFLLSIIFLILNRMRIKENERRRISQENVFIKALNSSLLEEKSSLETQLAGLSAKDSEWSEYLSSRINLIDKLVIRDLTGGQISFKEAESGVRRVMSNPEDLFQTITLLFSSHHPGFIGMLKEKGLTDQEIAYCCLYTLGIKSKEIDLFGSVKSTYRINSEIRKKLSLASNSSSLPQYLSELLKQVES